ncbi:fimbrial protein [Burkholderia stagnalis]|uniref:fimbrial protein n=1 Tax=Burkholderia stagnalis TaxID=1503054 RepID=UPI000AFD0619|nr:fimbrial protein [Burkholderia stagnalis]
MKIFNRMCFLATVLLMPNLVQAASTCYNLPDGGQRTDDPFVYRIPGFKVDEFSPNVPDGTIIHTADLLLSIGNGRAICDKKIQEMYWRGVTAVIGQTGTGTMAGFLYSTGVAGIGVRISHPVNSPYGYWPVYRYRGDVSWMGVNPRAVVRIEFIKTGPITAGGKISGEIAEWNIDNIFKFASYRIDGVITLEPKVPTCRVTTPAITVPLGSMPASTFTGIGSVSPSRPFNIVLQCSGGETGTVTNVYTTLTDHTNPGNVSDTLSLAQDSGATGIGIQVLNGNTVIKYGPDSSATGNTNQWKAGEAGNGTFTIPLTARYVQTAPKITPGTADGLATFTMSYQ